MKLNSLSMEAEQMINKFSDFSQVPIVSSIILIIMIIYI